MKTVCRTLGVARSHVHERHHRSEDWHDGRRGRTPAGDAQLLAQIREQISDLPSYGYRRACALVNRQRSALGGTRVNPKRAYRVMAQAGLLLPRAPRRRQSSRKHEGKVAVGHSDLRWCSDGLEIKCDSGQTVTATFAKDCCDREVIEWRAWEGNPMTHRPRGGEGGEGRVETGHWRYLAEKFGILSSEAMWSLMGLTFWMCLTLMSVSWSEISCGMAQMSR